jgi:hypothetical protein
MDDQPGRQAEPQYSPDGRWWWDGQQWVAVEQPAPVDPMPPSEPEPDPVPLPVPAALPVVLPSARMDKLGSREASLLIAALLPGEKVLGQYVGRHGQALVITDRQVLILKAGMMAGQTFGGRSSSFPYRSIRSAQVRYGTDSDYFEIATGETQSIGGAAKAPNCVPLGRQDNARFRDAATIIRDRIARAVQPAQLPRPDRYEQLQRLATLRDQGMLSPREFEAEKARILAS